VGDDGMAHASVWLQEVMPKNDPLFLAELSMPGKVPRNSRR
jgi:hypothetical protein